MATSINEQEFVVEIKQKINKISVDNIDGLLGNIIKQV